ncbi:hypothetical protein CDAR_415441 [Caerostris darwini]|uniref:Uncharacterized protein n=1 Tax=Caerostris darwini TaxID=1538125 RepID=A0AAV4MN01_9ARAC|nr:hypothetical protein CDAR_415441 [Caerostris darwini]
MFGPVAPEDQVHAMKKQPTPLRSHHQLEQCLADSLGPWLRRVCATLEPYHQLLPTEIVTHRTRPRFSIHLGTNRYAHVPTRVAASDVVLSVKALESVFCWNSPRKPNFSAQF